MSKLNILDDCNFGELYLLHPNSVLRKKNLVEFHFKSSLCSKKLSLIQDVRKIWHAF